LYETSQTLDKNKCKIKKAELRKKGKSAFLFGAV